MWPFKWKLSAWCYLFVKILENEICKFGQNLPLATFGSERVNNNKKVPTSHKCMLKEILKGILLLHTCKLFLGQVWELRLVMTGISENLPATSIDFEWFSEDFWMFPKVSGEVPLSFEHFWSYLKHNNVGIFFIWLGHDVIILGLFGKWIEFLS